MSGSSSRASGRFVLRIEPALHAELRAAASAANISLNEYCARKLAAPSHALFAREPARVVIAHASALFDAALCGVVVFGSWARGEAGTDSDVDILVIADSRRALTRQLYRTWDAEPLSWEGRAVEPHFVHLPGQSGIGTVWAEAALDGIVLFERGLEVTRALASVRHHIVAGRLVRRIVHGQPYWAEVA